MTSSAGVPSARVGSSPARVVFFGSGRFAMPILEALADASSFEVVGVVTTPDRPAGRSATLTPTPIAGIARAHGLTVLQPTRLGDPDASAAIEASRPDVGVLADYGRIIPPAILGIPRHGVLNVHPSLLPRHRGATPIPATILAGDAEAGVTVIAMDAGLDTGPIVASERWALMGDEDAPAIEADAARRGAALVTRTLPGWLAGALPARPQDDAAATLTRPLRRDDGRLDPSRPARDLDRMVRAYRPWPGTFIETDAGRLVVLDATIGPSDRADVPGTLVEAGDGLALATSDGRLVLEQVQPAGGRPMTAAEHRRGRGRTLVGTSLLAAPARGPVA